MSAITKPRPGERVELVQLVIPHSHPRFIEAMAFLFSLNKSGILSSSREGVYKEKVEEPKEVKMIAATRPLHAPQVLGYLRVHGHSKVSQIANHIGWTVKDTQKLVRTMRDQGLVVKFGTCYWDVPKPPGR